MTASGASVEVVNDGEPLIVMTDDSGHGCEHKAGCEARSRWYIERCSLPDEPYLPPVRYVCSRHVVSAFNELLELRRERRERDGIRPSTVPDHLPDNDESRGHGSVR